MKILKSRSTSLRWRIFWTIVIGTIASATIGLLVSIATEFLLEGDEFFPHLRVSAHLRMIENDNSGQPIDPDQSYIKLASTTNPTFWYVYMHEDGTFSTYNAPDWALKKAKETHSEGITYNYVPNENRALSFMNLNGVKNGRYVSTIVGGIEDPTLMIIGALPPAFIPILFVLIMSTIPFAYFISLLIIRQLRKSVLALKTDLSDVELDRAFIPVKDHGTPKELTPLLDSFNNTLGQLHASYAQQRQFATELTHELRTPIAAVMAQLQLLDPSKHNQAMLERLTQLHGFISQLLDSDRLRWGDDAKRGVEINRLVRDAAAQLAPLVVASKRKITFSSTQDTVEIVTDKTAISHVVHNLIANAILHGEGLISVTIDKKPDSDHVAIKVTDQGTSLKDEDISALSRRFEKGKGDGSGLGLSIANNIVNKLDGSLSGRALENQTEFTLTLPLTQKEH